MIANIARLRFFISSISFRHFGLLLFIPTAPSARHSPGKGVTMLFQVQPFLLFLPSAFCQKPTGSVKRKTKQEEIRCGERLYKFALVASAQGRSVSQLY